MNTTPYANSLFEQPWWLDIVAPGQWKEILVKDEKGGVLGRFPAVIEGDKVQLPELTQTLGVWLAPNIRMDYGKQKTVLMEIGKQLEQYKSVSIDLSPDNQYILPFRWMGYRMEPRFTYRLNDLTDCDLIYRSFGKTAKKNIKYAKNKVKVFEETNLDTLWELLNRTFEAQKRRNPMSETLVKRIIEICEDNGHGKYLEARDENGNVHSCAYFVFDEEICYYLLGASDSRYRSSGAQSLLLWEGIQFASVHSKVFDFEGSMVEGIENFFRQFGGVCTPYYSVKRQTLFGEIMDAAKPHVKKLLGYKN